MIELMATIHITEAELARDIHAVLARVHEGIEVIVEQDHRPVAVIWTPHRSGRLISEILRQARERNSTVTLDPDFGKDLEAVMASHPATMESAVLGVVLDSSIVITAERKSLPVPELVEAIQTA